MKVIEFKPPVDQKMVEDVGGIYELAKSGSIKAAAFVYVRNDGSVATGWSQIEGERDCGFHQLTSGVAVLLNRLTS